MSDGYLINHPLIKLEILLDDVDNLFIHEEIIPKSLNNLIVEIPDYNFLMHPIIVDKKSLVVLDGMHRVAAIQKIGYRYIPVCFIDYYNPNILVHCWFRLIKNLIDIGEVMDICRELNLKIKRCSYQRANKLVNKREAVTAIFSKSKCYAVYGFARDITSIYDIIKHIESKLISKGYSIEHSLEKSAKEMVYEGKFSIGLMTPIVEKKEVVDTARAKKVFPPKTTRHVIPARPLFIDVPVEWLEGNIDLSSINERLIKYLNLKTYDIRPPGQEFDRTYEEEVYVFENTNESLKFLLENIENKEIVSRLS